MAYCSHLMVNPDMNMFLAMILGGLIGMILMTIMMLLLMPFCGAFEVMIPLHINGMLIGMSAAMLSTLPSISTHLITSGGALAGLMVSVSVYFSNKHLTQS